MSAGTEVAQLEHFVEEAALQQIVDQMWDSYFGTVEPPVPAFGPIAHEGAVLCASVAISGVRSGLVTVTVPERLAAVLAAVMLQEEDLAEDDVLDSLGEVANIVAGNVKALVPDAGALGLPALSTATPRLGGGAVEVARLDAVWREDWLSFVVWLGPAQVAPGIVEDAGREQGR